MTRSIAAAVALLLALPRADPSSARLETPALERILPNANRTAAGRLRDGVLTIRLELRTGLFYPQADDGPAIPVQAFAEAGRPLQIPGPMIRVPAGTTIAATIRNTLHDSTLVLHGLHTRPSAAADTVQVQPGSTRRIRFLAGSHGTYFYWGSTTGKKMDEDRWLDSQLYGALIVDSAGTVPQTDERVFAIGLWLKPADSAAHEPQRELMVINGKSWPHTERLSYTVGDTVRWRWINPTSSSHPMHLHGFYFDVDSRGSWEQDTIYRPGDRRRAVTELLVPGATMTARWAPARPGNWLFHCHFAFHISNELYLSPRAAATGSDGNAAHMVHGMSGLVLGIQVRPGAAGRTETNSSARPASLRLVVQAARQPGDSAHLMGYSLERGDPGPAPDSVVVPGPTLVLERGRPALVTVVNRLREPTAVHWHGIELESFPDGVPGWSGAAGQVFQPIAPGDSFTAAFTPPRAGTFIYHSHSNELLQISGGLYGPLIVVEPGEPLDTATTRLVVVGGMQRNDSAFGVVNGRLDPAPIELRVDRTYRFRLVNIGDARTFFSLRRPDSSVVAWRAVAKDGADLPASQAVRQETPLLTGPGETADFEFTPVGPGALRLDLDSPFAPWHLTVPVLVRGSR
jgi:FtsP/CotA-like multicopper oxidase with cupredoxin domain